MNVADGSVRVFLADDDDDDSYLFAEVLREVAPQISFTAVEDGDALMRLLHATAPAPDMIFLDLNMPRKTGLSCLQEIRALQQFSETQIIIFSTSAHKEAVSAAHNMGADLYLQKPTDYDTLCRVISRCMSGSRSLREEAGFLITA